MDVAFWTHKRFQKAASYAYFDSNVWFGIFPNTNFHHSVTWVFTNVEMIGWDPAQLGWWNLRFHESVSYS